MIDPSEEFLSTPVGHLVDNVRAELEAGAAWIKVFADWPSWDAPGRVPEFGGDELTYPVEELRAATELVHRMGARIAAHTMCHEGAAASVEAGVDSIEHGWELDEALLAAMVERDIAWIPLLGIARHLESGAKQTGDQARLRWLEEHLAALPQLIAAGRRAGVTILAGTDWFPMVHVVDEIEELVRFGLPVREALDAATSRARRFFAVPDLNEGAPADLVVWREDPREDLARLRRPERVMLGGQVLDPPAFEPR